MEVPASAMLPCWQPPEFSSNSILPIPISQIQTTTTTQIPIDDFANGQNLTENAFGRDRPPSQIELEQEIEQLISNLTGPILSTIAPMLANAATGGAVTNNSRMRRQHHLK